jgi:hypothetical protein
MANVIGGKKAGKQFFFGGKTFLAGKIVIKGEKSEICSLSLI